MASRSPLISAWSPPISEGSAPGLRRICADLRRTYPLGPRSDLAPISPLRAGEPAEAFFLVDSGAVQMSYRTADGRQLPSRTHRAGDIFGASGLLQGASTRRDTAVALEPTTLKLFPHARFHSLMRQDSLIAEGLRRASTNNAAARGGAASVATVGAPKGYDG